MLRALGVVRVRGLEPAQVALRRRRHGPNRLREATRRSAWRVLVAQFESVIVLLLAAAAVLSLVFARPLEAVAIGAVIVLNAAIGFATEIRAVRSMEALRRLGRVQATVRRAGRVQRVPAEALVPGDVLLLEGGDVVPADARAVAASKLQADESALTGESNPVRKGLAPVAADAPLAERTCLLFKGSAVSRGSGEAVVVATGMNTELGRISALVEGAGEEPTPLERRLETLGRRLVLVTLALAAAVAASGWLGGRELLLVVQTAIALAVAAVPEGLPIVATVALARGMWRMARRHALIERLAAVETLGSTSVILTDKTGTLTENRMTVTEVLVPGARFRVTGTGLATRGAFQSAENAPGDREAREQLHQALRVAVLCNNAALVPGPEDGEASAVGEPTEVALLVAGAKAGLHREALLAEWPELREEAFDPDTKQMATLHRAAEGVWVAVKGAPERVLAGCQRVAHAGGTRDLDAAERDRWLARNEELGAQGLRVLAVAARTTASSDAPPYQELTFLGLLGLLDPPRPGVREALAACRRAGIRVVMVTGDQAATARHVASAVGLLDPRQAEPHAVIEGHAIRAPDQLSPPETERLLAARVIARASPEQKLHLLALHQRHGAVVAMTGDGVNDAPALKAADIGVAMGRRGTQVAREAADMVLEDDELVTIVAAVEQGRVIFSNLRRFVVYLLSCNASEIGVVAVAFLAGAPLPILPLQILFLNLVTDVFPALALGVGEGDPGVMERPPRPHREPLLASRHWTVVAVHALTMMLAVLGSLAIATHGLGAEPARAVTLSFLTLAFAQLWHVFNMRSAASRGLRNELTRNPWLWGALALCSVLLLAAVYVPILARVLSVVDPGPEGWALVAAASLTPLALGQILRSARPQAA